MGISCNKNIYEMLQTSFEFREQRTGGQVVKLAACAAMVHDFDSISSKIRTASKSHSVGTY